MNARKLSRTLTVFGSCACLFTSLVPAQFRQLYLSGKVTLPDGSPPPEPAIVRLYCADGRQPQAYTDRKGGFNFPVGGSQQQRIPDSSRTTPDTPVGASGPDRSFVSMTNCELRAELPGYVSSKINLGRRSVFESPDVGILILSPIAKAEGTLLSVLTLSAPKEARKRYEKARKELSKPEPDATGAARELEKAVEQYPQFAAAWTSLGEARVRMNDLAGARAALERAIAAEPKYVPPYVTVALIELQQKRFEETVRAAERALELIPDLAEAHFYRAAALVSLGRLDDAEASLKAVQASGEAERYPRSHFLLGNVLASRGNISGAAEEFRLYLKLEPGARAAAAVREQLDRWEAEGLIKP